MRLLVGSRACLAMQCAQDHKVEWLRKLEREREGGRDRQMRKRRRWNADETPKASINASWMNISTNRNNYCIASACDQGHGKKPGRKQRELCVWLAKGYTGIQRFFLVLSLTLSFIMVLRKISLLLLLIVRVIGLYKPLKAWAMNINDISYCRMS